MILQRIWTLVYCTVLYCSGDVH